MSTDHRAQLAAIHRFDQLVVYLRDEMGWPIVGDDFDDLTFDYTPHELGIDATVAAKIEEIKRLRPLTAAQPWGIFFVKFEPKRLPVVALRRILSQVALKKRASANSDERAAWAADDLLFVSNYGEGDERQITFAHFSPAADKHDLPTLKVLGWDNSDTPMHLDAVADKLTRDLAWPSDGRDADAWRKQWRAAFTLAHREVITTSKALSVRLAELARAIRERIKTALAIETADGPLTRLMRAFQEALVHDLDGPGFADMYAQTIAYGLLSARIANPNANTVDHLPAQIPVTNPFLKELMETFIHVGGRRETAGGPGIDFDELGVSEVVELLDHANMAAVVRDFGDRNPQEDPVIHFYELFLKEYDAKKRMQRGVFYTPRPVVSYIVRSVDELLRTEFGLADGLADTTTWGEMAARHADLVIPEGVPPDEAFVQILDPATGTATFLVETIDVIHRTMVAKWKAQGYGDQQIVDLWNAYVPAHLLPRLYGYELMMAPYAIAHLKIGLKLHETGYRFESDERVRVYLTNALEPAAGVGQLQLAGVLPALAHEALAVDEVKRRVRFTVVMGNPPYAGHSSNASVEDGKPTFIGRLIKDYSQVDGQPLGERNPKWLQDDYVKFIRFAEWHLASVSMGVVGFITNHGYLDNPTFRGMRQQLVTCFGRIWAIDLHGNTNKKEVSPDGSNDENVFDIQQGVAIGIFLRSYHNPVRVVRHADFWGGRELKYSRLEETTLADLPTIVVPIDHSPYLFIPQDRTTSEELSRAWPISLIAPISTVGIVTGQDAETIAFTRAEAEILAGRGRVSLQDVQPILYRPFDMRYIVYSSSLVTRPRRDVMRHMLSGQNAGIITTRSTKDKWDVHVSRSLCGHKTCSAYDINYLFPFYVYTDPDNHAMLFAHGRQRQANLTPNFMARLSTPFGLRPISDGHGTLKEGGTVGPEDMFDYIYGQFHSPGFRQRYAAFLSGEYARVFAPNTLSLLTNICRLGRELLSLHLMESSALDAFRPAYTGPSNPFITSVRWSDNSVWLDAASTKTGSSPAPGAIGFHGVPEAVWNFHIGGYQVCAKWLKDRKGRTLSEEDIVHYQKIVVALSETIRLMAEIDEVIEAHGGWPGAFAVGETADDAGAVTPTAVRVVGKAAAARAEPLPLFADMDIDVHPSVKAAEPPEADVPYGATSGVLDDASPNGSGNEVRPEARSIGDYDRKELKAQFLASLPADQWVEREDAIRGFARRLGFKRTGAAIAEAGRSVINGLIREKRLVAEGSRVRRSP